MPNTITIYNVRLNIWHSYSRKVDCVMHFLQLLAISSVVLARGQRRGHPLPLPSFFPPFSPHIACPFPPFPLEVGV